MVTRDQAHPACRLRLEPEIPIAKAATKETKRSRPPTALTLALARARQPQPQPQPAITTGRNSDTLRP